MRTIRVCAGIGDNIWLLQKLVGAGEKFRFLLSGESPRRGKQIFDLLPSVAAHADYSDEFSSMKAVVDTVTDLCPLWKDIGNREFYLSANRHLEAGRRLEEFLPDLPTAFSIDWDTAYYRGEAGRLLPDGPKYVGLYGSAYSNARTWGFWHAPQWGELARRVRTISDRVTFVILGASFDVDLAGDLAVNLTAQKIPHILLVGKPLGLVVEIMKRLSYFFAFPSGLGILSASVRCPTMMFYPEHLGRMTNAWADPEAIDSREYVGLPFQAPHNALRIAVDECTLSKRLAAP